ncbi:glycoside hydrolase family 2 protein [Bifidobacterium vespertilionis]|uniref:beta-mannosidase n=1 Tax=Bifidobacterium vespertilionis TaxID=2562524 RepID=A0A5J5E2Y0_9BIFI|nr:glycoside hydrolase family 2 protein [Bifidobacterium vespertilionis]KAA8819241.1 glycoside hydrolase family 2 protein [Bifidobacterium vespertilionis]KAA8823149.1 glycoside hydrolase family 2 protein [Bifidobacterium vespertilionis]
MTTITTPRTFSALESGWTLTALNPELAPEELRERLAAGIPATVPGEATVDLFRAGLIGDPFDGDNENRQQWIGDIVWRFTCEFDWHGDGNTRHDIVAYGLDTVAYVALNGIIVGETRNFHRTYRWDARPYLRDGANRLSVTFLSPVASSDDAERRRGYYPHTEHHAFNQIRKPSYSFGWDWGIDVANAGIWRPIGIDSWSGARIASVRPLVDVRPDGTGVLDVHVEVERAGRGRVMTVADALDLNGVTGDGSGALPVTVTVGGYDVNLEVAGVVEEGRDEAVLTVEIPEVRRWWPRGYGEQPLYDVHVAVGGIATEAKWRGHVGFRTLAVDTRADMTGRPFRITVNDVPVHARGYNWIPDSAFPSQVDDARYRRGITDLVESNSNMVRVWGGGIYEADEFYDMCDREGIMVWQDFMLACAAYPEDAETKAEVEAEAREQIARLSSHASLTVWNGSNENYVAYSEWWGFKQALRADDLPANEHGYGEKGWGDYYYSELFPALLAELDPVHVYLPSSPMSFTPFTDANKDVDGTMHIWDVWNRQDYRKYLDYTPRFADEFGYQAPPAWSTLTSVVHDEKLDPFGTQMLVHQKASGGNVKLARGMRSHLTPGRFDDVSYNADGTRDWLIPTDRWNDIEDWHWACQLQQAQAIRFGVEHMRSLEPVNAGALIWQINDDWPVVSWAAVDYNGHRKPLWYASRDFFAPRFATIQPRVSARAQADLSWEGKKVNPDTLALVVVNDTCSPWHGSWTVERRTLAGETLASQTFDDVMLEATSSVTLTLDASVAAFRDATDEILIATPAGDDGFARVIHNPAEVIEQKLDRAPFTATVEAVDEGYTLKVTAHAYARDVFCMVDKVDAAASIDGGLVTLLPGETVVWHIASDGVDDPQAFTAANVLRSANDLNRDWAVA